MIQKKESYKSIIKATSLFGGVQFIQLLVNLIRAKFIALLLGPTGMGISNLYLSSTTMLSNIVGLGLNFSAIRDISIAAETKDERKLSHIISIFKNWTWATGLLGVIVTIIFAPILSKITFGNKEYTWAFIWLSITLLLNALTKSNIAILQGLRKLRETAKSSVIGSLVGLFTSIPLYYFFDTKGIIPAIILASITIYIVSAIYTKKIKLVKKQASATESLTTGFEMVKLGAVMMISVFLGTLVTFIINAFIRYKGGFADVGLYQAGLSITNQFIGLVFASMGSDFFPRLSAISDDNTKVREMVNQQAEIVLLIAAPLLVALLVSAPLIIRILLSTEFYPIIDFVRWLALGMLFKAATYSIGYIAFAKGDKKVFFLFDGLCGNISTLILNVVAYNFWGLNGLGMSFLLNFLIFFIATYLLTKSRYDFSFSKSFYRVFIFFVVICVFTFIMTFIIHSIWMYVFGFLLFVISSIFSIIEIDKRIGLKTILIARLKS